MKDFVLSNDLIALKAKLKEARNNLRRVQEKVWDLERSCPHIYQKRDDSAFCIVCGKHGGWWCSKSQDGLCEYNKYDDCIYCGEPGERK